MSQKQLNVRLNDISQCSKDLSFGPFSIWPQGLPAVAVNGMLIAGFQQSAVFDHAIAPENKTEIVSLFRSLYYELTAVELSRLATKAQKVDWFPLVEIFQKYGVRWNDQIQDLAFKISTLPEGFQKFCSEKKWSFADFLPLLSAEQLHLEPFYLLIIERELTRSVSVQVFELLIELLMLGIDKEALLPTANEDSDLWLKRLKIQRYPELTKADEKASLQIKDLPWPGTSSARWVRQGDQAGIELKFFVANPTDLKKYVQSLTRVQEVLEKEGPWKKH